LFSSSDFKKQSPSFETTAQILPGRQTVRFFRSAAQASMALVMSFVFFRERRKQAHLYECACFLF
jgi:hypothetical protein